MSTWILGIAYRKALKSVRKDGRSPVCTRRWTWIPWACPTMPALDSGNCVIRSTPALATLPALQRVVIELAYFLGHSCEEIAVITDSPVNTVKTRMFHARERVARVTEGCPPVTHAMALPAMNPRMP